MLEIIESEDKFVSISADWKHLEQICDLRVFQTFDWCYFAWSTIIRHGAHNKLHIFYWHREQGIDSIIIPSYIDASGTLRIIFDGHSDTCDALYAKKGIDRIGIMEIAKSIVEDKRIRSLHFQKLPGFSQLLNSLSVLLKGSIVGKDNAYSWLDVKHDNEFIPSQSHMRSKDRADLKNIYKKASNYTLVIYENSLGMPFPRCEILKLRDLMRKRGVRSPEYFTDEYVDFSEKLYRAGLCKVAMLMLGGHVDAVNILLLSNDTVLSWVFFYDNAKSSTLLYIKYLCDIKAGHDYKFDFGVGVYSYKIGTFRPNLAITYSLRYSKSHMLFLKGIISANIRFLKDYLKPILKK